MADFRRWFLAAAVLTVSSVLANAQTPYLISTYAGGLPGPTSAAATSYSPGNINGVATDRFGDVYLSSTLNCVFRLDPNGLLTRIAGTCKAGYSGDSGKALNAQLNGSHGVALDPSGNLYIADAMNNVVRKVAADGTITTFAGTGTQGFAGDSGAASAAKLSNPQGIAADFAGNLYIADQNNQRIRKVASNGTITTVAGTGSAGYSGDGVAATASQLNYPQAVAVDLAGNLYIADQFNQRVRKVAVSGTITTVAGTGVADFFGDGSAATAAKLDGPAGVAVDSFGNLYIADQYNQRVRKVDTNGIITTFAGGNNSVAVGDNGPATNAHLAGPVEVAADPIGNVYIADQGYRIRKVDTSGNITTVAGTGSTPFSGDGGVASLALFSGPWGITRDPAGNLYIADTNNFRIRKITPSGIVSTFAGTGANTDSGDGGLATSAGITPNSVAADSAGNIYIGDYAVVRKIANGIITTVAGTGTPGAGTGDGGPATSATLSSTIRGLAFDSSGNLYISDFNNNRIRQVTLGGIISSVAGTGVAGFLDGLGGSAKLNEPSALAFDTAGNLYIADSQNYRIRELAKDGSGNISASSQMSTVAGNGGSGNSGSGDGGLAIGAEMTVPFGLALDSANNIYIATLGNTIRMVSGGIINTIAGTGAPGYSGDGGPALAAQMFLPYGLVTDNSGNIYVTDYLNNAVRILQPESNAPLLTVSSTHTGSFMQGQGNASYTITVTNAALSASTTGAIIVTDVVPSGLTLLSMSAGSGWNCSGNQCTSTGALAAGASSQITATVSVSSSGPPQLTNVVTVSGGGSPGAGASDPTLIGAQSPVLQIASSHAGNFAVGQSNATYMVTVGNQSMAAVTNGGTVMVTDTVPTGLTLVSMGGSGWNCPPNTNACTRNDALAGGASYSPITVTVNVSSSAPSQVINVVNVSGGGSSPNSASDTTSITGFSLCDLKQNGNINVTDVQLIINEALGIASPVNDLNGDGVVNVVDVQIEINAALGLGCAAHS